MGSSKYYACGILFCYNEEHILEEALKHYLDQGIDLVIFDNCSTDSSPDIAKRHQRERKKYPGKVLDVVSIETEGYEWGKILKAACDYMHKNLNHYKWILLIDADAFYFSPVEGISLLGFIRTVSMFGYNIVEGDVYEFYPTEKDNPHITSAVERLRYCTSKTVARLVPQEKIFAYHPSVDFSSSLGHSCEREDPRKCKIKFIYNHYSWVSLEHGLKKIFVERKPRYVERKKNPYLHIHYLNLLPLEEDLVKKSEELLRIERREISISPWQLLWQLIREPERGVKARAKGQGGLQAAATCESVVEDISQADKPDKAVDIRAMACFPETYHFLMTNYCNARCVFCNQDFSQTRGEITLSKFKTMVSHIRPDLAKVFYLSGGGEPLLCNDLFPIIRYVNQCFPWIEIRLRTNGLLIDRYAKELADSDLRLEISLHGATEETSNTVLQRKGTKAIFNGIALLNKYLEDSGKKMVKTFNPAMSQLNIRELPELLRKAAELKVQYVEIYFTRYYPELKKLGIAEEADEKDSLFYNQRLYDETVLRSRELADSLGVYLKYEPLFCEEVKERLCDAPWRMMVIDCEGKVFPCCGGEMWFGEKVESGEYRFGNLVEEDVSQMMDNDTYVKIRRTLSTHFRENFIPECENCHNTISFRGSSIKSGHIIRRRNSPVWVSPSSSVLG